MTKSEQGFSTPSEAAYATSLSDKFRCLSIPLERPPRYLSFGCGNRARGERHARAADAVTGGDDRTV